MWKGVWNLPLDLGRTASITDIAEQVLTFGRADSVTGQVLVVDGGEPGCMR